MLSENCGAVVTVSPVRVPSLQLAHFELKLFLKELLQSGQAEGVAEADHVLNLGVAMGVREVTERALHFADEIVEHLFQR